MGARYCCAGGVAPTAGVDEVEEIERSPAGAGEKNKNNLTPILKEVQYKW